MQYQLIDPWGGMKQGMSDFTNTMQNIATIKQNKKRTQIMEEQNERERAMTKTAMLKNQYQMVGMVYKSLDNIKDAKSYHETMRFANNYADKLEQDGMPDAAKQIRDSLKNMPLYDGELYQGMEGRRKNPDSKFEAWKQQTQLSNLAMLKLLGDDIKKEEINFGTRIYTITDKDGTKRKLKAESPEDAADIEAKGGVRGEPIEEKKDKTTRQAFTDTEGNVTNVIFGDDGKVIGIEPVKKDGKAIGRKGKVSEPQTTSEKVAEKTEIDRASQQTKVTDPKFKQDAIDTVKKMIGKEWDTYSEEEKSKKIEVEIDKQIRQVYTGKEVIYGVDEKTGIIGWYVDNKLVLAAD